MGRSFGRGAARFFFFFFRARDAAGLCASRRGQPQRTFPISPGCATPGRESGSRRPRDPSSRSADSSGGRWPRVARPPCPLGRAVLSAAPSRGSPARRTSRRPRQRRLLRRPGERTWHLPPRLRAEGRADGQPGLGFLSPAGRPGASSRAEPRRGESGWAGRGGKGRGRREGGRGRRASPRRGRALARAAGIARRRCGNVRHVGHGAGSGSGGRAADLECGSGRGRRGAVLGRGGRPCWGRGQCGGGGGAGRPRCTEEGGGGGGGSAPPLPARPAAAARAVPVRRGDNE